jgi:hypothetical protein
MVAVFTGITPTRAQGFRVAITWYNHGGSRQRLESILAVRQCLKTPMNRFSERQSMRRDKWISSGPFATDKRELLLSLCDNDMCNFLHIKIGITGYTYELHKEKGKKELEIELRYS